MSSKLLLGSELLSEVWAISPKQAGAYLPVIMTLLKGEKIDISAIRDEVEKRDHKQAQSYVVEEDGDFVSVERDRRQKDFEIPEGAIGVVKLRGVVRHYTGMSSIGTEDLKEQMQALGRNNSVKAVLLRIDSGGGSVHGTQDFSRAVRDFEKDYKKPLAVIIDGQACSAAYWIASGASRIFGASKTVEAGCIGTMITMYNWDKYLEMEGLEEIIVRASKSFNKNEEYYQAQQGNTDPMQTRILDKLNESFLSDIKRNRKGKIDLTKKVKNDEGVEVAEVLSGPTYYGNDTIKSGLIDAIASDKEVLKYLSREAKKYKTVKIQRGMNFKTYSEMSVENLKAEISKMESNKPLETDDGYDSHMESLQLAQTVLANKELTEQNQGLTQKVSDLESNDKSKDLQAKLDAETKKVEELNSKVSDLEQSVSDLNKDAKAKDDSIAQLTKDVDAANAAKDTAEAAANEATAKVDAYETFIETEYGQETVKGFTVSESGKVEQPEGCTPKVVYQTRAERRKSQSSTAKEIAGI